MLDHTGFDLWADGYDLSVGLSDESNKYPFAGYKAVLGGIFRTIAEKPNPTVLDLGFGTGILTAKLYGNGCKVYGQDFSARMIELASRKMPGAHLYQGDFSKGLAAPLLQRKYDFIVSTYALHHLTDEQKVPFLAQLRKLLYPGGRILIGDVAFRNRSELEACRERAGEEWDDEEFYFVFDEWESMFPGISFEPKSDCAGILTITC